MSSSEIKINEKGNFVIQRVGLLLVGILLFLQGLFWAVWSRRRTITNTSPEIKERSNLMKLKESPLLPEILRYLDAPSIISLNNVDSDHGFLSDEEIFEYWKAFCVTNFPGDKTRISKEYASSLRNSLFDGKKKAHEDLNAYFKSPTYLKRAKLTTKLSFYPELLEQKVNPAQTLAQSIIINPGNLMLLKDLLPISHYLQHHQCKDPLHWVNNILSTNDWGGSRFELDAYKILFSFLTTEEQIRVVRMSAGRCSVSSLVLVMNLTEDRFISFLKEKDERGNTFFHQILSSSSSRPDSHRRSRMEEALETIVSLCKPHRIHEVIGELDSNNNSVLDLARTKPKEFSIIFNKTPDEKKRELLLGMKHTVGGLLRGAYYFPELQLSVLNSLPREQRLEALREVDIRGCTVLHVIAENDKFGTSFHTEFRNVLHLAKLLVFYPEAERLSALQSLNNAGKSVLQLLCIDGDDVKHILDTLPPEERFEAINDLDGGSSKLLHRVVKNIEHLVNLLEFYPKSQRLKALSGLNLGKKTVLRLIDVVDDNVKRVLTLVPIEDRLAVIKELDWRRKERYAACYQVPFSTALEVLSLLPIHHRLEAVCNDYIGIYNICAYVARDSDKLEQVLLLLPENQRVKAVSRNDHSRKIPSLEAVIRKPEELRRFLSLLPAQDRFEFLCSGGGDGSYHYFAKCYRGIQESLNIAIELLPENQRLEALLLSISNKKTVSTHQLEEIRGGEKIIAKKDSRNFYWEDFNILHYDGALKKSVLMLPISDIVGLVRQQIFDVSHLPDEIKSKVRSKIGVGSDRNMFFTNQSSGTDSDISRLSNHYKQDKMLIGGSRM